MRTIQIPAYSLVYVLHKGEWLSVQVVYEKGTERTLATHVIDYESVKDCMYVAREFEHDVIDSAPFTEGVLS